jgi:pimeloyl-ACP methyl ester carboxylesterase
MQDWWQTTFPNGKQTLRILDASERAVGIAYGEKGQGKPLFLIHGVASWSYAWRYNIEPLSRHFRVICFDAKGSGFSDKPLHPNRPGYKVIELERVLQGLCREPAVVVAESLGALVTLAATQANPALFDRLVLINVPIFTRELPNWFMRLLAEVPLELAQAVDQMRLAKLLAPAIREVVYASRHEVTAASDHITPNDVYWATYPQIEFPGTITKLTEEFQLCAREIRLQEQGLPNLMRSVQEKLSTISCPVLVLWAEQDRWFPVQHGEQLRDRLPNAQFQIIPNCGHYAAGGQPEIINQAILRFLGVECKVKGMES